MCDYEAVEPEIGNEIGERIIRAKSMQPGPIICVQHNCLFVYGSPSDIYDYYGSQFPIALDKKDIDNFIGLLQQAKLLMETLPNV